MMFECIDIKILSKSLASQLVKLQYIIVLGPSIRHRIHGMATLIYSKFTAPNINKPST